MFNKIVYQFSTAAADKGFDNRADEEVIQNLKELDGFLDLADKSWKKYSALNGIPEFKLRMVSGYRCQELNRYLNGSETSPHLKGYAADITIKEQAYWEDFYVWASEFAKNCAAQHIPFDEIILERSGKMNWVHFSIRDFDGNQYMKSIIVNPDNRKQIKSVVYGSIPPSTESELTTDPMEIERKTVNRPLTNLEIEGYKGKNNMDTDVMSGSYMRCIYIMKRLMKSLGLSKEQAAGVVGNLIRETDGRLSTTRELNGNVGICQWNQQKQLFFRRLFLNENKMTTANLMTQTSFLIKEMVKYRLDEKLAKVKRVNDACMVFYRNYIRYQEHIDLTDLKEKKECSLRRAYSTAALEIYDNFINVYKDEWLVGYYTGNGVNDGDPIQKTNDTRLWNSYIEDVPQAELDAYAEKHLAEIARIEKILGII